MEAYKQSVDTVTKEVSVNTETGLTQQEAQQRLKENGRNQFEEAKKDSVWQDAPEDATFASVHHCVTSGQPYTPDVAHFYYRTLPKTPKQELIDSFAEKNALAMKCSGLNKELLEAFVKEYEEVMKPLDK